MHVAHPTRSCLILRFSPAQNPIGVGTKQGFLNKNRVQAVEGKASTAMSSIDVEYVDDDMLDALSQMEAKHLSSGQSTVRSVKMPCNACPHP
jgi:hypothetical protein